MICSRPFILLLILPLVVSCESTNNLLKAKAAPLSGFIEHPREMKSFRERVPFHKAWSSPDEKMRAKAISKTEIYIAPVSLQYLRPVKKPLVRQEIEWGSIHRDEQKMAILLRNNFASAFARSPAPRYLIARQPTASSVTLEMAIVELNPTSPSGNVVKTGLKFVVGPLAGLGSYFTKGNIAIEGKIRNSATGELLFQFADNEADRMTFYTLRDYQPYGHAVHTIEEWADQFERFTRTPPGTKIVDTFCFTLDPL